MKRNTFYILAGIVGLEIFWVLFFAISLGGAVFGLGAPGFPPPRPRPEGEGLIPLGNLGIMQMGLLFLMIFLYVGFRMHYARQYGEWATDEDRIKVFRAMNDLTQEALAEGIGVTRQTILAIEKGKYDPSLKLAFRISRFFMVPLEEIFLCEWTRPGE